MFWIFMNIFLLTFLDGNFCDYVYDIKYIQVPLDHFALTDNRTFTLKYLINDTYWSRTDGPIFFYTGNEGKIEMFAQNTGFQWEIAEKFQALVVFAEHRYYGTSLPPGSPKDVDYYRYLSSQQAMADFVDVIYEIKHHQNKSNDEYKHRKKVENKRRQSNPVIAFGGSYGGMLAAWMRMKYPAVLEGALASSAPILQFTDITPCESFNKVLTAAFNASCTQCVENIRKSWGVLRKKLSNENGQQWMKSHWKLCTPIKTQNDIEKFIEQIFEVIGDIGMTNYPYPTKFLMPLPGNPVDEMCKKLNASSLPDEELLISLFEAYSVYYNYTGQATCINWATDPSPDLGVNTWNVQACTEMVMPICANGVTDMFEPRPWNFTEYSRECYEQFKVLPNERYVEKMFGGKELRYTSNIIFSNGLLDPWSSGGVTSNDSPFNFVVILPHAAHHLDLRSSHEKDPKSVVRARKLYMSIFRRWIRNYRKRNHIRYTQYDRHLMTAF